MSASEIAVSVRGLSKAYIITHNAEKHTRITEALVHRLRNPFQRQEKETFWALKDVEFDIKKGDVVGIIGRNGAGKSTLLKILSRITEPTTGRIALYGRVGSLLEVGTGFHPELTGRENIFLNGAILGMTKREITRQFDAIVDFAGVEQFIDTPVKRYSSGMYIRLAFAVAAHLNLEILVVDEVLAVGDVEFQNKCLGKMKDVAGSGRTVLFVSHQMQAISTLCTRALYMQAGQVNFLGDVSSAIDRYMHSKKVGEEVTSMLRRPGTGELRFSYFTADKRVYLSEDDITLEMEVTLHHEGQSSYFVSLEIVNSFGLCILHLDSRLLNQHYDIVPRRAITYCISNSRLAQGSYTVNAYLCTTDRVTDNFIGAAEFEIAPILPYPTTQNECANGTLMYPPFTIHDTVVISSLVEAQRIGM